MQNRLLLVQRKNNTVTLILNRPEKKNSLTPELVKIFLQTLEEIMGVIRNVAYRTSVELAIEKGAFAYLPKDEFSSYELLNLLNSISYINDIQELLDSIDDAGNYWNDFDDDEQTNFLERISTFEIEMI